MKLTVLVHTALWQLHGGPQVKLKLSFGLVYGYSETRFLGWPEDGSQSWGHFWYLQVHTNPGVKMGGLGLNSNPGAR